MKTLIAGTAIMLLMTLFGIYQVDQDIYIRAQTQLKYIADDCAEAGGLYKTDPGFGQGATLFIIGDSEKAILKLIKLNMNLDDSLEPTKDSKWNGPIHYIVDYFDDASRHIQYKDGVFIKETTFAYGNVYTQPESGYAKLITEPTVIVTIQTGASKHRSDWLAWPDLIRSSAYEELDRN